jgi:hypothetical protein
MSERTSVASWVDAAARRARTFVALESLALALAAAVVVIVAAVVSGAGALEPATFGAAAIGAVACATTWAVERSRERIEIARRVDRKLDQRGALVTAFEGERGGASNPFVRSLAQRVAAALSPKALERAIPWPSPAFAAAPLIAVAVLAFAIDRGPLLSSSEAELVGRVAGALSSAAQSPAIANANSPEVQRVLASSQTLAQAARTRRADRGELARELSAAEASLSELAKKVPPTDVDLRAARDLTSGALAQLGQALADRGASGAVATSASNPSEMPASAFANGSAPRTMSDPAAPAQPPMSVSQPVAPNPTTPANEVGTTAGRWWPARYDAVVAAFVDASQRTQR